MKNYLILVLFIIISSIALSIDDDTLTVVESPLVEDAFSVKLNIASGTDVMLIVMPNLDISVGVSYQIN